MEHVKSRKPKMFYKMNSELVSTHLFAISWQRTGRISKSGVGLKIPAKSFWLQELGDKVGRGNHLHRLETALHYSKDFIHDIMLKSRRRKIIVTQICRQEWSGFKAYSRSGSILVKTWCWSEFKYKTLGKNKNHGEILHLNRGQGDNSSSKEHLSIVANVHTARFEKESCSTWSDQNRPTRIRLWIIELWF